MATWEDIIIPGASAPVDVTTMATWRRQVALDTSLPVASFTPPSREPTAGGPPDFTAPPWDKLWPKPPPSPREWWNGAVSAWRRAVAMAIIAAAALTIIAIIIIEGGARG